MARNDRRLRFYGVNDFATFFELDRVLVVLNDLDATRSNLDVNDVMEIHHATTYLEHDIWPRDLSDGDRGRLQGQVEVGRRVVGTFFGQVNDQTVASALIDLDFQYSVDVLHQLAKAKAFTRCGATSMLGALTAAGVPLGDLLACEPLVKAYDVDVRALMFDGDQGAELLITKFLMADQRSKIYLPKSLTDSDRRDLLAAYIASSDPNPNFLKLISDARTRAEAGIDDRLRLQAKNKHAAVVEAFFASNEGWTTGCEVAILPHQQEPVIESMDGMVGKYTYSRDYLREVLDFPSILNSFVHLFNFVDNNMILTLPSYRANLGVMERFFVTSGQENYRTGAAFGHLDAASLLQTGAYRSFLLGEGIELEAVIAWFFETYLSDEFGAERFQFAASSPAATYRERSRNLFSEMESAVKQFKLFVEDGELDTALFALSSEAVVYGRLPSLVEGKYVYPVAGQPDVERVLHVLFSDQSTLTYVNDDLQADSFAHLAIKNDLKYDDLHDYQKPAVDALVTDGILTNLSGRLEFASTAHFSVLHELWVYEACAYYHHADAGQRVIDHLVGRGWLERRSALLTDAERSYVNYFLNASEFSGGPDLRNRYIHGSLAASDDEKTHAQTYVTALRLLICLVIKINDDFETAARLAG